MIENQVPEPIAAAFQSGNLADAEHLCRGHLETAPDQSSVLLLLGLILQRQGRAGEAVDIYRRLTELHPDSDMHWGNYATALRVAGDSAAAGQALDTATRLTPDEPRKLEQLGLLQLQCGRLLEARDTLLRAWAASRESPNIRIHAARACVACRDSRAEILLQPWRDWLPLADELQSELADLLTQISEVSAAMIVLEDLLGRSPGNVPAQLLLAKSCERVNQVDRADELLRAIVAAGAADNPDVRREVAKQNAQLAVRKRAYGAARALLEQIGESGATDYGHYYALATVYDKTGDFAATMTALETANQRQADEVRAYAPHLFESDVPVLPQLESRLDAAGYRAWPVLRDPTPELSPVFVVGFPRSGTTLLEQMLDAHPKLQSMDERPFFNELANQLGDIGVQVPADLGRLDQRDCDELRKGYLILACGKVPRQWDARLVDKNPLNMLWLPMIHRMFPRAKIILALRHPCDVILSCYMQNFRAAPLAVASRSLESLANAYVATMENWLYHTQLIGPDVFVSRYEDLVADPAAQMHKITSFLDLEFEEAMLQFDKRAQEKGFIATPSYTQVIKPVHAGSIGHWQSYREYFEPIQPILRPMLRHWGYDTAEPGVGMVEGT